MSKTMNLTEDERWLLEHARDMDNPDVVEGFDDTDEQYMGVMEEDETAPERDYYFVERDELVHQTERIQNVREALERGLIEHGALSDRTVEQLSMDALWRECGRIEASSGPDALVQEPETGGIEALDSSVATEDGDEIKSLLSRARMLSTAAPERASELRSEAEALAGVEDYKDIELEVL